MIVMTTVIGIDQILLNFLAIYNLDMTMRPRYPVGPHSPPSLILIIRIVVRIQVSINVLVEAQAVGAPPEAAVLGMRVATP